MIGNRWQISDEKNECPFAYCEGDSFYGMCCDRLIACDGVRAWSESVERTINMSQESAPNQSPTSGRVETAEIFILQDRSHL